MAIIDIEYGKEILESAQPEAKLQKLQEMEMVLQNSSYGHEYAMLELQEAHCLMRQEELSYQLEEYKQAYFLARQYMGEHHPDRLANIESDLVQHKVRIFKNYHA